MTAETTATPVAKYMTRVQAEELLSAKGLTFTEQSGFLKVVAPGGRLYIAATKTVRRVDLSGFEVGLGRLTKVPHCGVFGQVKQQLELGETAEAALANLGEVIDHLLTLPAPVKPEKVKAPKAPKAAKGAKAQPVPAAPVEDEAAKAARIALIKKVAAEKGMGISKNSIASAAE